MCGIYLETRRRTRVGNNIDEWKAAVEMSGQKADIKFAPLPGKTRSPGVLHNYTEYI